MGTAIDFEKTSMDFDKMSKKVARSVWKYNKKTASASADYMRSIV